MKKLSFGLRSLCRVCQPKDKTEMERDRHADMPAARQADRHTDRETHTETSRQTDGHMWTMLV